MLSKFQCASNRQLDINNLMQYQVNTPDEYLNALQDDWRKEKLLQVWNIIEEVQADLIVDIEYKMLRFSDGAESVFHLNAQANYVSLYVGDTTKVDESGISLAGFNVGKGCIRIKKSNEVNALRDFIQKAIEKRKRGDDIGC